VVRRLTGPADRQAGSAESLSVPPENASLSDGKPPDGARKLAQSARLLVALFAAVVMVAACSPEEAELTTTTTTTSAETTTTESADDSTTTTVEDEGEDDENGGENGDAPTPAISDYEIVVRGSATGGETLWILIEPGDYTDIDLENLIRELVDESDATLAGINVFDDRDALEAGRVAPDARTDEEQELVDDHYLVSLVDGAIIRFQGPYEEFGETAVGS
jgi:hypothetical protein